ncbi:MAG: hypothetical protein JNL74_00930, partial [Fibrobacteres bacterium]|nr:hypothetical protein [Fibrobacterota bacterium]
MIKLFPVLILALAVGAKEVPIKFSFCGSAVEPQDTINTHISILYGKASKVHGASISLFGVSTVLDELHGIQSGGIVSLAYGSITGYQVSGFVSYTE